MGHYDSFAGIGTLWHYAKQYALAVNYFTSAIIEAPTNQLYLVAASDDEFLIRYTDGPRFDPLFHSEMLGSVVTEHTKQSIEQYL